MCGISHAIIAFMPRHVTLEVIAPPPPHYATSFVNTE